MSKTYLTTDGLADRLGYPPATVRDRLRDSVLLEGVHYFRPFGGQKVLYIWESIERDIQKVVVPVVAGGDCYAG